MIRRIYLQDSSNGLNHAKYDGQNKDQYCNPECIPLNLFTSIVPPLRESFRLRLIVSFVDDGQSFMPVSVRLLSTSTGQQG